MFTKVSRLVGMNPIAQAVARQKLIGSILRLRIQTYLLDPGEECWRFLDECSFVFVVTSHFAPDPMIETAMETAARISQSCAWDKASCATFDAALELCRESLLNARPASINQGIKATLAMA